MARVITFSTKYPSNHIRKVEPTFFVEKFYKSFLLMNPKRNLSEFIADILIVDKINVHKIPEISPKHHTIRAGKRWRKGDLFSPRIWSGKPYNSKQIKLAPDTKVEQVWDLEIKGNRVYINEILILPDTYHRLVKNDGLTHLDFESWFKMPCEFSGQIICWNSNIKY